MDTSKYDKREARKASYSMALDSLFKEIESIRTCEGDVVQRFLDNQVSKLVPPSDEDRDLIIQKLKELKEKEGSFLDPNPNSSFISVQEIPRDKLLRKIVKVVRQVISMGTDFVFAFPSRRDKYQIFDQKSARMVLKKGGKTERSLQTDKAALSLYYALLEVYKYCISGEYFTKRGFYYNHKTHFSDQAQANKILEDLCLYLGCTMGSIGVSPNKRGEVIGDLKLVYKDKSEVNCTEFKIHGHSIPNGMDQVASIRSESALFVLLVEKQTVFVKLAQNRFHDRFRCIMMTAKGYGDIATRLLLRRIQKDLKLPIICVTDFDPHGLEIVSIYRYGSKNLSFDSHSLVIPNIRWLGILWSDKEKFSIPNHCLMNMTEASTDKGKNMAERDYIKENELWCKELDVMITKQKTIGIEALKSIDDNHLVHTYLPQKLLTEDWLL